MTDVVLRPDLKTAGGEVNDILWNDQFIGTMTLVYREADRISGAIQLEEESLPHDAKQEVVSYLQSYVQSQIDAMGIQDCDVLVTYSPYDQIIATGAESSTYYDEEEEPDQELDWTHHDRFGIEEPIEQNEYGRIGGDESALEWDDLADDDDYGYYELVVVEESRNKVEYHIYDDRQELVAEAGVRIAGRDISGTVNWRQEPDDDEIEAITDLVVSDFDEDEVDTFVLQMKWEQEIIETIELTHEDLLWDEDDSLLEAEGEGWDRSDYTLVLARDDGDTLTYEIYQQSYGGLPIGTATVDISERQLTGFIDFREPGDSDDREYIATLLMQELDKEKEYESINLTMLFRNQPFEELLFETDQVH